MRSSTLRRLIWAVDVVLVGALVAACYASYRTLAKGEEVAPSEVRNLEGTGEQREVSGERRIDDYAVIWQLSMYGEGGERDVVISQSGQSEMRLLGVALVRGEDGRVLPGYSSATILEEGKVEVVGLGEMMGGWELVRLEEEHAVLRRADEEKLLPLEAAGEGSRYAVGSPVGRNQLRGNHGSGTPGITATIPKPGASQGAGVGLSDYVRRVSNVRWEVDRRLLELIGSDAQVSQRVMSSGLILPHKSNGEPDGVGVKGVVENGLLAQLGFRKGDIIISVNGEPVYGLVDFWGLVPILLKRSSVEIKVLRSGTPITFHYDVRR